MNMANYRPTQWRGSPVRVVARVVPRFLWQTASIDVLVDERPVLRTGGQLRFVGDVTSSFSHQGALHSANLAWGLALFPWFPYRLSFDGVEVSKGRVYVQRWYIGLCAWIAAMVAITWLVIKLMLWWALHG